MNVANYEDFDGRMITAENTEQPISVLDRLMLARRKTLDDIDGLAAKKEKTRAKASESLFDIQNAHRRTLDQNQDLPSMLVKLIWNLIASILNALLALLGIRPLVPHIGNDTSHLEVDGVSEPASEGRKMSGPAPQALGRGYESRNAITSSPAAIKNYAARTRAGLDVAPSILKRINHQDMVTLAALSRNELKLIANARQDDIKAHFTGRKPLEELVEYQSKMNPNIVQLSQKREARQREEIMAAQLGINLDLCDADTVEEALIRKR